MIFLYRFELLEYDAALQDFAGLTGVDNVGASSAVAHTLFLHTNYEQPITLAGDPLRLPFLPNLGTASTVYSTTTVQHDGLRYDEEANAGDLSLTLSRDHPVSQMYAYDVPSSQVWVTVAVLDTPAALPLVVWSGRIRSADFDEQMCKLVCTPIQTVLNRNALTKRYPRSCGHQLYDLSTCGVNRDSVQDGYWKYREDGFVSARSADGFVLTVPAAANRPSGFFVDGTLVINGQYRQLSGSNVAHFPRPVELTSSTALEVLRSLNGGIRRSIEGHSGAELSLLTALPPAGVEVGMRVTVFKGCNRSLDMCETDFNNVPRYGGYPFIPIKNIFETGAKT